ncbi:MAG: type II toxin-antitoxin system VapC family toxin [Syntrophobacteraceae bacterium]|nr:type II toxin-antitoxin system VapC family toxin [Syntrophobacteraceae bacterium]
MRARYLLDTNIASFIIKGASAALDHRLMGVSMAHLAISAITEGELRCGVAPLPQATRLHSLIDSLIEEFLLRVTVLPWDSDCAQRYGLLRATLEREGRPMGNLDMMIGAHALALKLILITNDRAFERIKGMKIEDWTKAVSG